VLNKARGILGPYADVAILGAQQGRGACMPHTRAGSSSWAAQHKVPKPKWKGDPHAEPAALAARQQKAATPTYSPLREHPSKGSFAPQAAGQAAAATADASAQQLQQQGNGSNSRKWITCEGVGNDATLKVGLNGPG